jgi:hypothetical protein
VVGVRVNKPPPEFLTYLKFGERTWAIALATIALTVTALVLWRRAVRETPGTGRADVAASVPGSMAMV